MKHNKNYVIVPSDVRHDTTLSSNAKILYGEISALCRRDGVCFASTKYFMNLFGACKSSVIRWIGELEKGGYVQKSHKTAGRKKRRVIVLSGSKNDTSTGSKNDTHNNTINNNTSIITSSLKCEEEDDLKSAAVSDSKIEFYKQAFLERMELEGAGRNLSLTPELRSFFNWLTSRKVHKIGGTDTPLECILETLLSITPKLFYDELDKSASFKVVQKELYLLTCLFNRVSSGFNIV